jgi:high-affinity Fe2+/Pb2+ permease
MNSIWILNAVAFVFTIGIVLYGISKGFNNIELITNLLYFAVLIILHIKILQTTLR